LRAEGLKGEVSLRHGSGRASSPLFRVLCLLSWRNKKVRTPSGIWRKPKRPCPAGQARLRPFANEKTG